MKRVLVMFMVVWMTSAGVPSCEGAQTRPNLVFILADDLGWGELGCYGQTKIRTPNIDRLAREGMRFTRHYSGAPVCAPSRCVLLTGRHLGHAEIRGNLQVRGSDAKPGEGQHPLSAGAVTLAEVLKGRGYATGAFGKWGLGPPDSTGAPHRQGFDHFFGYNCQAVAHSYYPPHLWRNGEKVPLNARPVPGHRAQPTGPVEAAAFRGERYAPEVILEEALGFLRTHRNGPFFLYLPFIEPHVAMQPPEDLVAGYPLDWDDRPYRGQCGYTPFPRPRAGYAAMITSLDRHVGRVLEELDRLGLAKETIVVFTSDNGTTHGAPADPVFGIGGVDAAFFNSTAGLRGRKGSVYEGGIRVPLIVRWPGRVKAGRVTDFPCYFPDHFPTWSAAAGVNPGAPSGRDGINLLPILTGRGRQEGRTPMVWVFPEYGGQVAVQVGRWKTVRTGLITATGPGPWELFDLVRDPWELNNLAGSKPDQVRRSVEILRSQTDANAVFPVNVPLFE